MTPPNMNKQYRAEIRALKGALKQVRRDDKRAGNALWREHAHHYRAMERLEREGCRQQKRVNRATAKIEKRISILEGRLS